MDGLFHGKPYFLMDDLGGFTPIFGSTAICWFHGWIESPPLFS